MDFNIPARSSGQPGMISLSYPFEVERTSHACSTQHVGDSDGWSVLPTDVIGLVARELGPHEAQAMTRVCRGWLQAIDRTLAQLKPRNLHAAQLVNRCKQLRLPRTVSEPRLLAKAMGPEQRTTLAENAHCRLLYRARARKSHTSDQS